jgi:hypothetical protein
LERIGVTLAGGVDRYAQWACLLITRRTLRSIARLTRMRRTTMSVATAAEMARVNAIMFR